MTFPTTDTTVLYPDGATTSTGIALHREVLPDGRIGLVLDRTAFHPVDMVWPDQPADRGTLSVERPSDDGAAGDPIPVLDCIVGATDGNGFFVGSDVPVKKGTEGWAFLAVHILASDAPIAEGDRVLVEVDAEHRAALSAGHTACHLASLALNRALSGAWRKDVPTDAAGAPNFDALAIETSSIRPNGSVDVYRIGKSLRRKGFDPEQLTDLDGVVARVDATLAEWVASGARAHIEHPDDALTGRREWVCELPDGTVRIPCGGTHVSTLEVFERVSVTLDSAAGDGATTLTMTTTGAAR